MFLIGILAAWHGLAAAEVKPVQTSNEVILAQNNPLTISVIGFGYFKKPSLAPLPRRTYRILVGKDYPPFNYRDSRGKITGFNVEIAHALCLELNLACQIVAKNWPTIAADLAKDRADFAVASLAISRKNLLQFEMTSKYYDMPARFVIRKNSSFDGNDLNQLRNKNIGVVANSAHEAYAQRYFTGANINSYPDLNVALEKLVTGKLLTIFADALTTKNWLDGENSLDCCEYTGDDFYEPKFFGQGAAIALPRGKILLRDWLNNGLATIWATGRYEEIYKQYFVN